METLQALTQPQLIEEGYVWIREDQPWGTCPTYRHPETGDVRYCLKGKYVTRNVLEGYLKNDWVLETAEENTYKWTMLARLDWAKTATPPVPKTETELRAHLAELLRSDQLLSEKLTNPTLDSSERLQTLEALISNMGLISGLKLALGA